jgi:UDP-N-acetyl-D-mannosaminuronate dehydrogenase
VVAIIGIGYVGFHLVTAFSKYYKVIAFDVSSERIATVAEQLPQDSNVYLTSEASSLALATHFLVAVPTPLIPNTTDTDTSIIRKALGTICEYVRPGATIVIESSVSIGLTRSLLSSMIDTHNLYAGMSPEVSLS